MGKINAEMYPGCVELVLIPEKSHNKMMTKLKNQYKLNQ